MQRHCEEGGMVIAATHAPLGFSLPGIRL